MHRSCAFKVVCLSAQFQRFTKKAAGFVIPLVYGEGMAALSILIHVCSVTKMSLALRSALVCLPQGCLGCRLACCRIAYLSPLLWGGPLTSPSSKVRGLPVHPPMTAIELHRRMRSGKQRPE